MKNELEVATSSRLPIGGTLKEEPAKASRLPAGSTLEIAPGVHVPHPHAEVNLPGKPDARIVGGGALTETLAGSREESSVALHPLGEERALADEVIPGTLTTVNGNVVVPAKQGHDAVDLLVDTAVATGQPAVANDTVVETER